MTEKNASRRTTVAATIAAITALVPPLERLAAQDHSHEQEAAHHEGLHFSHPLVTESVSPDTKVRLNVGRAWETEGTETEVEVEGEYAFHRSFSIEFGAPFAAVDPDGAALVSNLGNLEVMFKFANYALEQHGLLLGYGLEFGVPTGDPTKGIGSDHIWEIEPFLNLGYRRGRIELVGYSIFGIPFNQDPGEEVETELSYDISGLVHVTPQLQGLLEVNGQRVLSGAEAGANVTSVSPGVKIAPAARIPVFIGLGATVPLTDEELHAAAKLSLFYHF